nr:hypothetical protein [Wadden Sea poxvirus]
MTTVPVTDINDYIVTEFSEDGYPSNKNYEITTGQLSILKTVNEKLLSKQMITELEKYSSDIFVQDEDSPETIIEHVTPQTILLNNDNNIKQNHHSEIVITEQKTQKQQRLNISMMELETTKEPIDYITSIHTQTPSLGVVFDKDKRIKLLEDEIVTLKKQKNTYNSSNLDNFTQILFGKVQHKINDVNKRMVIVNYANLNNSPLTIEDLEVCSDEEIDRIYKTIKQYHENRKRKIIVTNMIIIIINILEQILLKLGLDDIKGLSNDVTSEIIDVEIGDDCEAIANKMGIGNSPTLNIILFILKLFIKRIHII